MKKIVLLSLCLFLIMGAYAFAGGGGEKGTAAAEQKMTIKFGHNGNTDPSDPQNIAAYAFQKMIGERSNGRVEVQVYPAAQLGDARTLTESVQMGSLEIADIENGPLGGFVPQTMVWDLPYLFRDLDHANKVAAGPVGDQLRKLFLEKNIRILDYNHGGFRYLTNSKRPVKTPDDLKGLKIRVMESKVMIESINAFGASAVPMAFGEVYTALQQGTVDGQENPFNLIVNQKFFEVQKHLSLSEHFYYPRHYLYSELLWKKYSPETQKLLETGAKDACEVQRKAFISSIDTFVDFLKKNGMQITEVDRAAFMKVSQPVYPMFYATLGAGNEAAGKALVEAVINTK